MRKLEKIKGEENGVMAAIEEQLYQRPGFMLRRATQLSAALFSEMCPDVTPNQYGALLILRHNDDLNQKRLAQLLFVDQTNVRIILEGLEKKGFVRRIKSELDRRRILVQLTQAGRLSLDQIEENAQKVQDVLLRNLTSSEQKKLSLLLAKLLAK